MHVAPATLLHLDQLAGLLGTLFAQEADFTPDRGKQVAALTRIISDPSCGRILVAQDGDDTVLGMVSILPSISTAEGGTVFWLEDMVVHPDARGRGIGRALLDAAIDLARSLGGTRITLLTDASNEAAIRFYGRCGFQRSAMTPLRLSVR